MITSTANAKVKQIEKWQTKSKKRREDGVFLAEGIKMFREAPTDWILEVYLTEDLLLRLQEEPETLDKLCTANYETVSKEVFSKMSDTQTPQGILTVLKQPEYTLERLLQQDNPLFIVLEDLQDPGNLGTILRTGEGAGISGVIMNQTTVDIFNPKTIRSTMGSVYRVPFVYVESLEETIGKLKQAGIKVMAAHLQGKAYFQDQSFTEPVAFMIGNEGNGLREATAKLSDGYIKIPMEGMVESLNAAIAASLLLYETYRQRHS